MESLRSLRRIQRLKIRFNPYQTEFPLVSSWEGWEPPRHLSQFCMSNMSMPRLPAWVNSACIPHLTHLTCNVPAMESQGLDVLGGMPELRYLWIQFLKERSPRTIAGGGLFPNLRSFETNIPLMFLQGAMPMLRSVHFSVSVYRDGASIDVGLGNLPVIKSVSIYLEGSASTRKKVEEAEAALWHAVRIHPNHPKIFLLKFDEVHD